MAAAAIEPDNWGEGAGEFLRNGLLVARLSVKPGELRPSI